MTASRPVAVRFIPSSRCCRSAASGGGWRVAVVGVWTSMPTKVAPARSAQPCRLDRSSPPGYAYGLMFDQLSAQLNATLQKLTGRGVLTEDAVKEGLREIRRILLEADVSFDLTRDFLERVQAKAVGVASIKEVRPGHQLVKIVYDELVTLLGEKQAPIAFASVPPTVILLVGLQGSGKTTTAGKLAKRLKLEQKAPFLVAADIYRPAAAEQLATLATQVEVGVYADNASKDVVRI